MHGGLRNLAPLVLRKTQNRPISQAESGFDLRYFRPGKVFDLAFRQRREIL